MTIVIDANTLFSALITPNGKIAKILAYPSLGAKRITCHFLIVELQKHLHKIAKAAKRPEEEVIEDLYGFLKNIIVYDETVVNEKCLKEAKSLTKDIDLYDLDYVALALQTGGILWTGDKKLSEHLISIGFDSVINTSALYEMLNMG